MKIRVRNDKVSKERYTLLYERSLKLLREYWREYGRKNYSMEYYLFTGYYPLKAIYTRTIELAMCNFIIISGITKKSYSRHFFATHLMNDGVDLITIKTLMGHSSVSSTMIYLHFKDYQSLRVVVSPLDKLE